MDRLRDRQDAGRQLAERLIHLKPKNPVVLALPRGGVPVGAEIAKALGAPLDVLVVRKIGAPGHEELGLGAVVGGVEPQIVWNEEILHGVRPSQSYLDAEIENELEEIDRRTRIYRGDRTAIGTRDRTVIIVDDGIATGGTARAALRGIRQTGPKKIVLAVGVAPTDTLELLDKECDELVCLLAPRAFYAVGAHYREFGQTSDDEVIALLEAARQQEL